MAESTHTVDRSDFDAELMEASFHQDPYPALAHLRKHVPVYDSALLNGWIVSRYPDVDAVFRNNRDYSTDGLFARFIAHLPDEERNRAQPMADMLDGNVINMTDPPAHTRLRRVLAPLFFPSRMARFRKHIARTADELIDGFADAGQVDLVAGLSAPLPRQVLIDFLGVDRSRTEEFAAWADDFLAFLTNQQASVIDGAVRAFGEMSAFLEEEIDKRLTSPTDDVLGILASAQETEGLTHEEIIMTCVQLIFAGAASTRDSITSAVLLLLQHPDQWELFRSDPERYAPLVVEEMLRYESPGRFIPRLTRREVVIEGVTIPEDAMLWLNVASANRDPIAFDDPDRFDILRKRTNHVAFGIGIHLCVGAPLARTQGELAVAGMVRRFPSLRLVSPEPNWGSNPLVRQLLDLRVAW